MWGLRGSLPRFLVSGHIQVEFGDFQVPGGVCSKAE